MGSRPNPTVNEAKQTVERALYKRKYRCTYMGCLQTLHMIVIWEITGVYLISPLGAAGKLNFSTNSVGSVLV